MRGWVSGLLHMSFRELSQETGQERVIPAGSLEFSLYRALGTLQPRQVAGQAA